MLKPITYLIFVILLISSCKPEQIEPNGFYSADYITKANESQIFEYFYDDGELVAGGLDDYLVKLESESGTFTSEELILINYKSYITELPDTLIPFTYFMGLKYTNEILKDITVNFNLNYQFNNIAHTNYAEFLFFTQNIDYLKLYKINYNDQAALYYDADIDFSLQPFEIINNNITFKTKEKNALFGLCWEEPTWTDTILFERGTLTQQNVYSSNRAYNTNTEGAYVENNILNMHYSHATLIDSVNSTQNGSHFYKLNLLINNPTEGVIDHNNIYLDLMIEEQILGTSTTKSYLKLTNNSVIEIIEWPEYGKKGILEMSGLFKSELSQGNVNLDLTINFLRQR